GMRSITSGSASSTVVPIVSRPSSRSSPSSTELRPAMPLMRSSQSGWRLATVGITRKLYECGGDAVAHSSVDASQGLGPAPGTAKALAPMITEWRGASTKYVAVSWRSSGTDAVMKPGTPPITKWVTKPANQWDAPVKTGGTVKIVAIDANTATALGITMAKL